MEEVTVEGDGAAVAHVPEGGLDGVDGLVGEESECEGRGEATADGDEEKREASESCGDLFQQTVECSCLLFPVGGNAPTISRGGFGREF